MQSKIDPDPFYYRPQVDAPRHPRLLQDAVKPFRSPGIGAPWLPVLGDHDVLVQGELVPTDLTRMLALGDRALWTLPQEHHAPAGQPNCRRARHPMARRCREAWMTFCVRRWRVRR